MLDNALIHLTNNEFRTNDKHIVNFRNKPNLFDQLFNKITQ